MRGITSENVTLSACDGCGGVWVTPNRLNALILQSIEAQDRLLGQVARTRRGTSRKLNPDLQCPYDHIQMFTAPLGMLTQKPVQTCPQCYGLFLSHGILDDIILGQRR